ncbi:YifB family Mg chelatase-like AAA ATPase [Cellulomonas sp. PS-H5]|uniref:YifB family Mg chelatase-like AAA ATPase n=1 Tax=Cellulomonas sp. PS-H5 TaxID=2820400 RepID=UPI001C501007|nr:YifB family Mg chelatase-like AAA ATPase [Cellulomonas sp. PS-H5]MBW0255134.1 YifB family Mg chelatase-like AAA ATPase [Cellulomonas sp. PS-H5]
MALGRTRAVGLVGLTGHLVEVEAHLASSLPAFALVGLPDTSLAEARDRVRAAVGSTGLTWPNRRITVNLSPAALPKSGPGFDLAVAVAVLAAAELLEAPRAAGVVHLGELGLDGRLRPVRGVLPAVAAAVAAGHPDVVVPEADAPEAALVPGARVVACRSLAEVVRRYGGAVAVPDVPAVPPARVGGARRTPSGDLADVLGQGEARAAVEVAAAGGHHLLLVGPPGAGKTMLASRLPGLLPDLDEAEAVEVTAVHSVAGTFDPDGGLLRRPPFEDPHHTATPASIVGGGSGMPRPGAASRAHRGVLFLDEAPEFPTAVLQTLRQPLEHGEVVVHRAAGAARYPARFQLVLAANPCPCGRAVGTGIACTCRSLERRRYFGKISGPLLDRVDVQVEVPAVRRAELGEPAESTAIVAARVAAARTAQAGRWAGTPWRLNGDVPGRVLRDRLGPGRALLGLVDRGVDRGTLTLRGADRVLRLAWTVADLAGRAAPSTDDVGRAVALRTRGQGA